MGHKNKLEIPPLDGGMVESVDLAPYLPPKEVVWTARAVCPELFAPEQELAFRAEDESEEELTEGEVANYLAHSSRGAVVSILRAEPQSDFASETFCEQLAEKLVEILSAHSGAAVRFARRLARDVQRRLTTAHLDGLRRQTEPRVAELESREGETRDVTDATAELKKDNAFHLLDKAEKDGFFRVANALRRIIQKNGWEREEEMDNIAPTFIACRLDMSQHCSPEFLARCGGKVYLSGFFDDNLNTHICSAEKMVYVHALEFVPEQYPEDEEARDALNGELLEDTVDDDYFGRATIERLKKEHPENFRAVEITFDEDDDPAEVVREHLQGNPEF
jgi:hypothetical protein